MIPRSICAGDVYAHADIALLAGEMNTALADGVLRDMAVPAREVVSAQDLPAAFVSMPAVSGHHGVFINKVATVCPRGGGDSRPMVHALVLAFCTRTGEPLAVLDGAALTTVKCAAVTALVTHYCTPTRASVLAIIGAGVQARQQFRGVRAVRNLAQIRVHTRDADKRRAFVQELRAEAPDIEIIDCASVEQAVADANIVGTATGSSAPLAAFDNLASGAHINSMGAHTTTSREIPNDVLERSVLVVEHVPTAVAEAGVLHADAIPLHALPTTDRRYLRETQTVFSSTGHASLDAIATAHILARLR